VIAAVVVLAVAWLWEVRARRAAVRRAEAAEGRLREERRAAEVRAAVAGRARRD
jgi:hypothetical protein